MKKFNLALVSTASFMLFGCFSNDDDAYRRTVDLSISDAIVFENKENYSVGDTLIFELKFSRYLPEEGYPNLLDVFETSSSDEFGYSFGLSKFSEFSGNFEFVNIDPGLILGSRSDNFGYYGYGYSNANMAALLNEDQSEYTSKVGIILVENGRYNLNLNDIQLSSGYDYDKIIVDINHVLTSENSLITEFNVSEN